MTAMNFATLGKWIAPPRPDWWDARPWLLVGKGPSFDAAFGNPVDAERHLHLSAHYNIFGLNHVATRVHCDVVHVVDVEVLTEAHPLRGVPWLLVPAVLHRNYSARPGVATASLLASPSPPPALAAAAACDMVVVYDKHTGFIEDHPGRVCAQYFSAEAALCLLGLMGVRTVATVGLDGGKLYARAFDALPPLRNGRASFDDGRDHLQRIAAAYGLRLSPLVASTLPPVRRGTDIAIS